MPDYQITIELVGVDTVSGVVDGVVGALKRIGEIAAGFLLRDVIEAGVDALKDLAAEAVEAAGQFQLLTIRFDTLLAREAMMSGEAVNFGQAMNQAQGQVGGLLDWVRQIAVTTPFSVESIGNTLAMAQAFGFSTQQAKDLTLAVGDFTAGMGLSDQVMFRIVYHFGQLVQQGKLSGQTLRFLAQGAMFPINQVLGQMQKDLGLTNLSLEAFRTNAAAGKYDVYAFFTAFEEIVKAQFPGSMQRMSQTIQGVRQNFDDLIRSALGGLVLLPAFDKITAGLNNMIKAVLAPDVRDQMERTGKLLASIVTSVGDILGVKPFSSENFASGLDTVNYWLSAIDLFLMDIREGDYTHAISLIEMLTGWDLSAIQSFLDNWGAYKQNFIDAVTPIQTIVDAFIAWTQQGTNTQIVQFNDLVKNISGMDSHQFINFSLVMSDLRESLPVVSAWLQTIWVVLQDAVASILPSITPGLENLHQAFLNLFTPENLAALSQVIGAIGAVIGALVLAAMGLLTGLINGIAFGLSALLQILPILLGNVSTIIEGIKQMFSGDLMGGLVTVLTGLRDLFLNFFQGLAVIIFAVLAGFVTGVINFFVNLREKLVGHSIVPEMLDSIVNFFKTKFQSVLDFITGLVPKFLQIGKDIIGGLWDGFKAAWATFLSNAKGLIAGLPGWVKDILGIHSPPQWSLDIGSDIMQGMRLGMLGAGGAPTTSQTWQFNINPGFLFKSEDNLIRDVRVLQMMTGGVV
jgi:hypothetical protein